MSFGTGTFGNGFYGSDKQITGTVFVDGTATSGITVFVLEGSSVYKTVETDTNGDFEVEVTNGEYHLFSGVEGAEISLGENSPFVRVQ